ncbi:conserved hypothetical protein [Trichophyton verrucosum HKI 0517]|uniref:Mid2 domain-containing protein n=1 Tax=Trichophyton verrucosum (strain HKI 0517) TaxID=663202 RepID=D4DJ39_TRIVH|nr:uncharacterized protein TRV_07204 [Trichophyton verrucosum HKI 0517]EFE38124.1 conserved hypothetical protein [Trichophyton verrucosum HKI 0517]
MGIFLHILFLLSHNAIHSLALDCRPVRIDGPSVGQRSNYTWEEGLPIQFGGWSDEEIKTCIGKADAYNIWLVSEDPDCPVVWPVFDTFLPKEDLKWSPFHFDLRKQTNEWYVDETLFARSQAFFIHGDGDEATTLYTTITSTSTSSYTTLTTATSTSASESSVPTIATVVVTRTLEPTATGPVPISHEKAGLSTGAKAGIGTGVALGSIAIAAAVYILILLRRRRNSDKVIPMVSGKDSNKYSPPGPPEMHDEVPGSLPVVSETNDPQKRPASEMLGSIPVGKPTGRVGDDIVHHELP